MPTRPMDPEIAIGLCRKTSIPMRAGSATADTCIADAGEIEQARPDDVISKTLYSGAVPLDVAV